MADIRTRGGGLPEDALTLLHELQVHQVELEMQNEALRATQAEVEADLARFVELGELGRWAFSRSRATAPSPA